MKIRDLLLVLCIATLLCSAGCSNHTSTAGPLVLENEDKYGLPVDVGQDLVISLPSFETQAASHW